MRKEKQPASAIKSKTNSTDNPPIDNDRSKIAIGELTIEQFGAKHSCSLEEATKLQQSYLKIIPDCTHPLAICSAILSLHPKGQDINLFNVQILTQRLITQSKAEQAKQSTKPKQ